MVDGVTDRSKPLHPVLEVLQSRLAVGSKPGARADGYKVGLAIEGGGMRGVLSAGMAAALKYLGLQDAIDVVYGSSAGSIIGAYFVSGQVPLYGASIYYDSICSDRFISKRALLSSPYLLGRSGRAVTDAAGNKVRPVLYLDALLDEVIKETKPLDWDAFVKHSAKQPLKPVASSLTAMRSEILDGFSTLDELLDCLRASARVPGIAGDPVAINGAFYSDAMIFEPVPFRSALADGCTHVLVLRTKPETSRLPSRPGIYEALIAAPYFNRNPDSPCPAAARFVLDGKHIGIYKEVVEDLRRRRSGWVDPAAAAAGGSSGWVLDVVPAWDSKEVAQLETRPRIIYNGARNGFAAAYEALSPFATPSAEVYGTNRGRGGKGTAVGGPAGPPASGPPRRGRRAPTPPPPSATPPPSPGAAASSGIAGGQAVAATVAAAATPPAASAATAATPRLGSIRRKADAFGAPTERLRAGDVVARFVFRDDVLEAQLARTSSASAADAAVTPGVLAKLAARRRRRARGGASAAATASSVLAAHAASSAPPAGAAAVTAGAGGAPAPPAASVSAAMGKAATRDGGLGGDSVGGGGGGVGVSRGMPDGTASTAGPAPGGPTAGALVVVDARDTALVATPPAGAPRRQGLYQRIKAGRVRKLRKTQQQQHKRMRTHQP